MKYRMKIATLSDIHDNVWKLADACQGFGAHISHGGVDIVMICCGDLCSPFIVDQLAKGFTGPIHTVFWQQRWRMDAGRARVPAVRLEGVTRMTEHNLFY